ncbi:MAG: two-component system, NarL family, response regulator NreC [Tenuifilum sp.]|jgi:DNA-binding NarL/FixJ family response regulator|uniref:response regulator transcription factor n=1 Tax=Tenuifilum sp. TaxID=2760880 RepID=UPI0024AA1C9F|nr:response regulator transcription factor [Tenuifilum sp.]MDI3526797.1 two-component system, NarL family, response regulator NreC [Tenuifilum sp.]
MDKIRVALVEDHQLVRDGIRSLLTDLPNIEVVAEADCAKKLLNVIKDVNPDVMLVDISLPEMSGVELTNVITSNHPDIKVIILSMHIEQEYIFNSLRNGAKGYLHKSISRDELIEAIEEVHNGGEYFSKEVSGIILKNYLRRIKNPDRVEEYENKKLTPREMEILKMVAQGYSNQLIAEKLFISVRTVESHKNHIMQKLELTTVVDLVKYAIKNKIIDL